MVTSSKHVIFITKPQVRGVSHVAAVIEVWFRQHSGIADLDMWGATSLCARGACKHKGTHNFIVLLRRLLLVQCMCQCLDPLDPQVSPSTVQTVHVERFCCCCYSLAARPSLCECA